MCRKFSKNIYHFRFNVITYFDKQNYFFLIPDNIEKYFSDYERSEFIECNRDLAKKNLNLYGSIYGKNLWKQTIFSKILANIKTLFQLFKQDYWLTDGTLLGWYRDCSIIPHTHDLDLALDIKQFNPNLIRNLLGNKKTPIAVVFGMVNDSLELKLVSNGLTCDLFFYYDLNSTHIFAGYHSGKKKMRNVLSKFDRLCSAELLNQRHFIPCNYLKYLQEEYGGKDLENPKDNYKGWTSVYNKNERWREDEYPNAIKFFDKTGNFEEKKTLNYVNSIIEKKITKIEYNFDEFFKLKN